MIKKFLKQLDVDAHVILSLIHTNPICSIK